MLLLRENPLVPLQETVRLWITTVAQPNVTLPTEPLGVRPLVLGSAAGTSSSLPLTWGLRRELHREVPQWKRS